MCVHHTPEHLRDANSAAVINACMACTLRVRMQCLSVWHHIYHIIRRLHNIVDTHWACCVCLYCFAACYARQCICVSGTCNLVLVIRLTQCAVSMDHAMYTCCQVEDSVYKHTHSTLLCCAKLMLIQT